MMKIHTTQNLNLSADTKSTNITLPRQIRLTQYSNMSMRNDATQNADSYESVSFKGKKSALDKAAEIAKKSFGERVANTKGMQKILGSDSFGKALEFTGEQEVMIQAATALAICCALRPATIMALPGDKDNKKNCAYASAHSFSSGVWGFIVPFLFIKPLANGYNHALQNAGKYIKEDATLKKMWSHLDEKSLRDANGIRKPMEEWKDIDGFKFIAGIKDVRKIPQPKHISEISDKTLEKKFANIDLSKVKGNSANKWVDKNGNPINIKIEDMFIAVKDEETKKVKYYPLMHVEENILKEIYPELNVKSIVGDNGKRLHPDQWKKADGSAFEFNKDHVFISDWAETDKSIPLITGKMRKEGKDTKDVCYQKNNNENDPWSLGKEITEEMVECDYVNTVLNKLGAWLPDIVVAYPRATATIALLPFVLKNVLGLEKHKKTEPKQEVQEVQLMQPQEVENDRKVVA